MERREQRQGCREIVEEVLVRDLSAIFRVKSQASRQQIKANQIVEITITGLAVTA
ncbi:MAG: hypothetical protein NDJ89_18090 [Oligoflexia bacterium]|nr:hypothetical protein [Oligoflexia bacterium]